MTEVESVTLDPVVHQPTRLAILAALYRNREMSFRDLRDGLNLTPGNLGSHAARLEEAGYVASRHAIVNLSIEMRYRITEAGIAALHGYLAELRAILVDVEAPPQSAPETRSQ